MVYQEMSTSEMIDDLMGDDYAGWTYDQAVALSEYYELLSDETDSDIEWDPVSIRCEWDAYDNIEDVQESYPDIEDIGDLEDSTMTILSEDGSILLVGF